MATVTAPELGQRPLIPPSALYRFSVDQYRRMIDAGVFQNGDRCELLEGWVVRKMVHNPAHDGVVWLVQTLLLARLAPEWVVRVQSSIQTADSRPEPDVAVVRGPGIRYITAHPAPQDISLVVEVAEATLVQDRTAKQRIYARARIPCYWIVNLTDRQVEVYTNPRAGRSPAYRERRDLRHGDSVPLELPGRKPAKIPVRELLP